MVSNAKNEAWLLTVQEAALEPDLRIIDPHHHLWDIRPGYVQGRYLLDDMLADVNGGHNIVSTVFIECGAMFSLPRPTRLPITRQPTKAAIPALICTTVPPAKSIAPIRKNRPVESQTICAIGK